MWSLCGMTTPQPDLFMSPSFVHWWKSVHDEQKIMATNNCQGKNNASGTVALTAVLVWLSVSSQYRSALNFVNGAMTSLYVLNTIINSIMHAHNRLYTSNLAVAFWRLLILKGCSANQILQINTQNKIIFSFYLYKHQVSIQNLNVPIKR